MTQKQAILDLLKTHGTVTMGMIADQYPYFVYTARNRVGELKRELAAQGLTIKHTTGKSWRENAYHLVPVGQASFDFENDCRCEEAGAFCQETK